MTDITVETTLSQTVVEIIEGPTLENLVTDKVEVVVSDPAGALELYVPSETELTVSPTSQKVVETSGVQQEIVVFEQTGDAVLLEVTTGPRGVATKIDVGQVEPSNESGNIGDIYIIVYGDDGTVGNLYVKNLSDEWELKGNVRGPAGSVETVNGHVGPNVVLTKADVELGLVTNDEQVTVYTVQTIEGKKTFAQAPVVPDDSFEQSAIIGLSEAINGTIKTFFQDTAPEPEDSNTGDLWFNSTDRIAWRFNGTNWATIRDTGIQEALDLANTAFSIATNATNNFYGVTAPENPSVGDLWFNTSVAGKNKPYHWNGTDWVALTDQDIAAAKALAQAAATNAANAEIAANQAIADAADAQATADGKVKTYFQATGPTGLVLADAGDLWFNSQFKMYRWDGGAWLPSQDTQIGTALSKANSAESLAGTKITTFYQDAVPTSLSIGDLWVDTDDQNHLYRATSVGASTIATGAWVSVRDAAVAAASASAGAAVTLANEAMDAAVAAQATADGSIRTYYSETPPWANNSTQPDNVLGDMWFDQTTGQAYRWNGTEWQVIEDSSIAVALAAAQNAQSTADGKITAYYAPAQPVGAETGDLWYDTSDKNKPHYWDGDSWEPIRDQLIVEVQDEVATKTTVRYEETVPGTTPNTAGDTWFQFNAEDEVIGHWEGRGGTTWVKKTIDSEVIANLNVAKLTGNFIDAQHINTTALTVGGSTLGAVLDTKVTQNEIDNALAAQPKTWTQDNVPTSVTANDIWIDTNDGNKMYRAAVAGATTIEAGQWVLVNDPATTGVKSFATSAAPSATGVGDIWIDTDDGKIYRSNAAGTGSWVLAQDYSGTVSLVNGWKVTGKTTIDGGVIEADSIAAASIKTSQILITPSQVTDLGTSVEGTIKNLWGHPSNSTLIDGGEIYTNSIKASSIQLADWTEHLPGSVWGDTANIMWTLPASFMPDSTVTYKGQTTLKINGGAAGNSTATRPHVTVIPGETYHIEFWAKRDATWNGTFGYSKLRIANANGGAWMSDTHFAENALPVVDTWYRRINTLTIPDGVTSLAITLSEDADAGTVWVSNLSIRRKYGGDLIVDGAIDGKVITGATIQTETTASRGIKLDATGLKVYSSTNALNMSIDAATGDIEMKGSLTAGSIITGSTFQTTTAATSGVKITNQGILGYNSANQLALSFIPAFGIFTMLNPIMTEGTITGAAFQTNTTTNSGIKIDNTAFKAYSAGGAETFSIITATGDVKITGEMKLGSTLHGEDIVIDSIDADRIKAGTLLIEGVTGLEAELADKASGESVTTLAKQLNLGENFAANPYLDTPTGSTPTHYTSTGTAPTKTTAANEFRTGSSGVKYTVTDSHGSAYIGSSANTFPTMPNSEFVTISVDVKYVSGTNFAGSGLLLRWHSDTTIKEVVVNFNTEIPSPVAGTWYRIQKVIPRPDGLTGNFTWWGAILAASFTSFGTTTTKTIIFDRVDAWPSTTEEITAYLAPTDATNKANNAAVQAIETTATNTNSTFNNWTGTYPDGWSGYGTGGTFIKNTADAKTGDYAVQWVTASGLTSGLKEETALDDLPLNLEYVTVEVDVMLTSGTFSGAGILLDWKGLSPERSVMALNDIIPSPVYGKYYRVTKVLKRPESTGTHTSWLSYIMTNYNQNGLGSLLGSKTIIFDRIAYRPSTAEEISAYTIKTEWSHAEDTTYIDGGKIYTNSITADQIDTEALSSGFILSGNIQVGQSYWNAIDGFVVPQPGGGEIRLPADGLTPATFSGIIEAGSAIIKDNLTLMGKNNSVIGELTLASTVTKPLVAPTLSNQWPHVAGAGVTPSGDGPVSTTYTGMAQHPTEPGQFAVVGRSVNYVNSVFYTGIRFIDKASGETMTSPTPPTSWGQSFLAVEGLGYASGSYYIYGEDMTRGRMYIYRINATTFAKTSEVEVFAGNKSASHGTWNAVVEASDATWGTGDVVLIGRRANGDFFEEHYSLDLTTKTISRNPVTEGGSSYFLGAKPRTLCITKADMPEVGAYVSVPGIYVVYSYTPNNIYSGISGIHPHHTFYQPSVFSSNSTAGMSTLR